MRSFRHLLLILLAVSIGHICTGQGKFSVKISHDTISIDETIKLEFLIQNIDGTFTPPDLSDFTIASGPMTSSQYSMINGEVTQSKTYTYILIPRGDGDIVIPPAILTKGDEQHATQPIDIYVTARHSGYKRQSNQERTIISPTSPTKRRILKRI
jgi:hypothetical protein